MKRAIKQILHHFIWISWVLFLLTPAVSRPGGIPSSTVILQATVNKKEIAPDETFQAEVIIQWSGQFPNAEIVFPGLRFNDKLALVSTASMSSGQEEKGELILQRKYTYTLQGKEAGVGVIEPVTVQYALQPGQALARQTLTSAPLEITISRMHLDFSEKGKKIIGLASILVLFLILVTPLGIIIRIRQKEKAHPDSLSKLPPSPEDQALQSLDEAKQYRQAKDMREYHAHIATTIKRYVAQKYQINTTGKTTLMILEQLSGSELAEERKGQIDTILSTCDRAKFANYEPGVEEMNRIYALTRDFILSDRAGRIE